MNTSERIQFVKSEIQRLFDKGGGKMCWLLWDEKVLYLTLQIELIENRIVFYPNL